jgi:hypothetical protein
MRALWCVGTVGSLLVLAALGCGPDYLLLENVDGYTLGFHWSDFMEKGPVR